MVVEVEDVQIRLSVELKDHTIWVCTWYGHDDDMRFAALLRAPEPLTIEQRHADEAEALALFREKIGQLDKQMKGIG